jgi:hypothetical protein
MEKGIKIYLFEILAIESEIFEKLFDWKFNIYAYMLWQGRAETALKQTLYVL